jgi:4-amino-4-deoxy-L-arabinose transferase-like glycosyltransferase
MIETSGTATGADRVADVERVLGMISESRLRSFVAILVVALIAFLPGFRTIAPLDRDEPQYALETKAMIESGQFGAGLSLGLSGHLHPAGVNFLQWASVSLFGNGAASPIWVYRLPSLIAAISVALLTWWMALAFGRPRAAFIAAILIVTTPLLAAEARLATADAVLLAAIVLAEGALARLWFAETDEPDYRNAFLFWTGLGLGILAKGFIAPLVVGLTIAVLCASSRKVGWLNRFAPVAGSLWLAVLLAPLLIMAAFAAGGGLGEATVPAGMAVQEAYEAPPGSYAVLFYPLFGPAGVFVALAIPGVIERIHRPVFLFAVAWIAPFWLLVELWPVKLPYYILPAYPALALVGATAVDEGWLRVTGWISTYFSLNLLVWPVLVAIGATILFFVGEDGLPLAALPFFAVAIVVGIWAFLWFYSNKSVVGAVALSVLSTSLFYVGLFGGVFAQATALHVSERLVAEGKDSVACSHPHFASTGLFEPSLVFYAGDDIRLATPEIVADFLAEGGCRVAFVEGRRQSIFNQRAADIGLELNVKNEISGYNIGNWKRIKIRIFAVEGSRP